MNEAQLAEFKRAWMLGGDVPPWLLLQQDIHREGCAVTKNKAIARAVEKGAEMIVVLDDDCFPSDEVQSLPGLISKHRKAMEPQPVPLFATVTNPPSRGTPYTETSITMPVAASMGFWTEIGDYCAVRGLALQNAPMTFDRRTVFGQYFPLCGMNLAFCPGDWKPWCDFIEVQRFDDIWMGWLWQREAYRRGFCFNLNGPLVRHARQSNIWRNLTEETAHLQTSETLWQKIAMHPEADYATLRAVLPV